VAWSILSFFSFNPWKFVIYRFLSTICLRGHIFNGLLQFILNFLIAVPVDTSSEVITLNFFHESIELF